MLLEVRACHRPLGLPQVEQLIDWQSLLIIQVTQFITDPDHPRAGQPLAQETGGVGTHRSKPLNQDSELFGRRYLQAIKLRKSLQAMYDFDQFIQGDDHAACSSPQLADPVPP